MATEMKPISNIPQITEENEEDDSDVFYVTDISQVTRSASSQRKDDLGRLLVKTADERRTSIIETELPEPVDPLLGDKTRFKIPFLRDPLLFEDDTPRSNLSVRLGLCLSRTGEESHIRLLQKELNDWQDRSVANVKVTNLSPNVSDRRIRLSPRGNNSYVRRRRDSRGRGPLLVLPNTEQKETAIQTFRRIAKVIQNITGICLALKSYVKESETEFWSPQEMYLHVKEDLDKLLAFNPQNFSKFQPPKREEKLERLLHIPPDQRTPHHLKTILAFIRTNWSFQDYPANIQIELCKRLVYQKYEARRIILKQGHPPSAFYFILSGTLIVNIMDVNSNSGKRFVRTAAELTPGDCFGELALLEEKTRTATIICKTSVELAAISKEDFHEIIRKPLLIQRRQHIRFLQSTQVFKDFPCEELALKPDDFFYQYIPKNKIIIKDIRVCKYLIAVKSGKCKLVGEFGENTSNQDAKKRDIAKDLEHAFPYYTEMKKWNSLTNRPKTESAIDETSRFRDSLEVGLLTGLMNKDKLEEQREQRKPQTSSKPAQKRYPKGRPLLHRSSTMSKFFDCLEQQRRLMTTNGESSGESDGTFWATRLSGPASPPPATRRGHGVKLSLRSRSHTPQMRTANSPAERREQMFAQVATLTQGAVFGLESLVEKPQTALSLVSDGAECLFISRDAFLKEANIKTLRVVNDMVMKYPSQIYIREQVDVERKWIKYKQDLVHGIVSLKGRHD